MSDRTLQLFKRADNDEGYISVICHRPRYLTALAAMGWCETAEEASQQTESAPVASNDDALADLQAQLETAHAKITQLDDEKTVLEIKVLEMEESARILQGQLDLATKPAPESGKKGK
jgi:hypothetical protein